MEERIREEAAAEAGTGIKLAARLRRKNGAAEEVAPISARRISEISDPMSAKSHFCAYGKAQGDSVIVVRFTRKGVPAIEEPIAEELPVEEPITVEAPVMEELPVEEPTVEEAPIAKEEPAPALPAVEPETAKEPEAVAPVVSPLALKGRLGEIEYVATSIDGAPTKHAFVYLPQGYNRAKKYPVLYLLHGVGGTETEWLPGGNGKGNCLRLLEQLKADDRVKDFIIVFPNGRTCPDFNNTHSEYRNGKLAYTPNVLGFFDFDQELRADLIPAVESIYSVSKERADRALAGLSMGGMQAINLGICKCLDLFGWYGAFSAGSATTTGREAGAAIANGMYPVSGVYLCCGTEDAASYPVHRAFTCDFSLMAGDRLSRYKTELLPGLGHTFEVWDYAFAQFVQFAFAK